MEPKYQKEIIEQLASKYNLPISHIRKIAYSPFKTASKVIKKGNLDKMLIAGFGSFSVHDKRNEILNG